jgi:hypothetical protein
MDDNKIHIDNIDQYKLHFAYKRMGEGYACDVAILALHAVNEREVLRWKWVSIANHTPIYEGHNVEIIIREAIKGGFVVREINSPIDEKTLIEYFGDSLIEYLEDGDTWFWKEVVL